MTNQLAIYNQWEQIQSASIALYKSGLFADVKSEAQAMVKVMAGAEIGIPPFASMTGISVIQGKPVLGGNIIATLIKNSGRYDYRIKSHDNTHCTIAFFEHGKAVGESTFGTQDAEAAGLLNKDNWKKYRKAMFFNRAISQGARWYAPGIFGGAPVYTADEMGADTDEEGYIVEKPVITKTNPTRPEAEIIEELGYDPEPEPAPMPVKQAAPVKLERPLDPDSLRSVIERKAIKLEPYEASDKQRNFLRMLLQQLFTGNDEQYRAWLWFMFDATSSKDLTGPQVKAILDWLKPTQDSGGAYVIDAMAEKEAKASASSAIIERAIADGQQKLI